MPQKTCFCLIIVVVRSTFTPKKPVGAVLVTVFPPQVVSRELYVRYGMYPEDCSDAGVWLYDRRGVKLRA